MDSLSNASRSVSDLPLELLSVQCTVNGPTIAIKYAVGADLAASSRSRSCVNINARNCGHQQKDEPELQLNGDCPARDPKQSVRHPRQIGEIVAFWRSVFGICCSNSRSRIFVFGVGEWQHGFVGFVVGRCRWPKRLLVVAARVFSLCRDRYRGLIGLRETTVR